MNPSTLGYNAFYANATPTFVVLDENQRIKGLSASTWRMSKVNNPAQLCFIYDGMWFAPYNFLSPAGLGKAPNANIYVYGRHNRPSGANVTDQVGTVNVCMLDGSVGAYKDAQLPTSRETRFGGMIGTVGPGWNMMPTFNLLKIEENGH